MTFKIYGGYLGFGGWKLVIGDDFNYQYCVVVPIDSSYKWHFDKVDSCRFFGMYNPNVIPKSVKERFNNIVSDPFFEIDYWKFRGAE